MKLRSRRHCWCFAVLFGLLASALHGCAQGVPEDRTITFSGDGRSVAFQHGDDGVYIRRNGTLIKLFSPDAATLATSTPRWSPSNDSVIFTTCKSKEKRPHQPGPSTAAWDANPDGRIFSRQPVRYTCWLTTFGGKNEKPEKPVKLFEADCNHPGYIATSSAVRWGKDGKTIFFVRETSQSRHTVFEFDRKSKKVRRIFLHAGEFIAFDYLQKSDRLVCVLGSSQRREKRVGIWIGKPRVNHWWHISATTLHFNDVGDDLARVRRLLPVWDRLQSKFAFCRRVNIKPSRFELRCGEMEQRKLATRLTTNEPLFDLHWSPDGRRIGCVKGRKAPRVFLVDEDGSLSPPIGEADVSRFAGWSADGEALAYVSAERTGNKEQSPWSLLLCPIPAARDVLHVAPGDGHSHGIPVFSGMRTTFPHWSPTRGELSFWATYVPTHRGLFSGDTALRPGDPALTFDLKTRVIRWMPVNAFETTQAGHFYLLHDAPKKAADWYDQAERQRENELKAGTLNSQRARRLDQASIFRFHCYSQLDRKKDAKRERNRFVKSFEPARGQQPSRPSGPDSRRKLSTAISRGMFAAEAFLSLNKIAHGIQYLRSELRQSETDAERFGWSIPLAQLLLHSGAFDEYAELVSMKLIAVFSRMQSKLPQARNETGNSGNSIEWGEPHESSMLITILPLLHEDFLRKLPASRKASLVKEWSARRQEAGDATSQLMIDHVLAAAYRHLGDTKNERRAMRRISKNARRKSLGLELGITEMTKMLRHFRMMVGTFSQNRRGR